MRKIYYLRTLNNIFVLLLIAAYCVGQDIDTTLSGQVLLIYSDFTWELGSDDNQGDNPFENPANQRSSDQDKANKHKLVTFLEKEEIFKYIKYKEALNKQSVDTSILYDDYLLISNDLIKIQNLSTGEQGEIEVINSYLTKYLLQKKELEHKEYKQPEVTGKTISNKIDCITTETTNNNGNTVKTSQSTPLLTYTPLKLQNYYKQKNYLTVNTSVSKSEDRYFINFEFIFNSKDIEKSYGTIPSDGFLRLSLINNKKIFFKIPKTVYAKIESYTGRTIYTFSSEIKEKEDIRLLKRKYVSEIGLLWSSGFEDYPIFNIDHFMQKMKCIDE